MTTRKIVLSLDEFYHLYNRGVEKRTIFLDSQDHERFIELLFVANTVKPINLRLIRKHEKSIFDFDRGEPIVSIGAYCLMPNHFHILVTSSIENGISLFMNKLSTSYSMYFNKKYNRTGALFEGSFKAKHADSDEYLKYLYSYIHLNPVKLIDSKWKEEGVKDVAKSYDFATSFKYSSLQDYMAIKRKENGILNMSPFPEYFQNQIDIKTELFEWLTFKSEI